MHAVPTFRSGCANRRGNAGRAHSLDLLSLRLRYDDVVRYLWRHDMNMAQSLRHPVWQFVYLPPAVDVALQTKRSFRMYEGVAFSALWKLMGWLPGFLLRWRFSKEDLKSRIRIDVRNRPHAVQLNGGEVADAAIWVVIHNAGYFPVELDRATVTLAIGYSLEFYSLDRVVLAPDATHEVCVRGPLTSGVIAHYKLNRNNSQSFSVSVRAEFNSKIHNFSVNTGYLSGLAIHAINM